MLHARQLASARQVAANFARLLERLRSDSLAGQPRLSIYVRPPINGERLPVADMFMSMALSSVELVRLAIARHSSARAR